MEWIQLAQDWDQWQIVNTAVYHRIQTLIWTAWSWRWTQHDTAKRREIRTYKTTLSNIPDKKSDSLKVYICTWRETDVRNQKFSTLFTNARHWTLYWARWIRSTHYTIFSHISHVYVSSLPRVLHALSSSLTWSEVCKLWNALTVNLSAALSCFLPLLIMLSHFKTRCIFFQIEFHAHIKKNGQNYSQ